MALVYGGRRVDYMLDGEWRPFPPPTIYVADIPALVTGRWRERTEPALDSARAAMLGPR